MQQAMRFDLANGFPLITERSLKSFWRKSIGELCAFINGATTLDELAEFGCDWWGPWATPEKTSSRGLPPGSLGPGSYGGAFRDFPTAEGGGLRPVQAPGGADRGTAGRPDPLRLPVDPAVPGPRRAARRRRPRSRPATAGCTCGSSAGGLHLHMFQRSGDVPVGVPANMIQYAALLLMLEQLTGIPAVAYYHTISDAHVYENQVDAVAAMLERRAAAAAHGPADRGGPEGHRHPRLPRRALRAQRLRPAPGDLVHPGLPMIVSLVVAASANDVIGADGALPWHLPADMRRFRELTTGHVVVMGRLTYESILAGWATRCPAGPPIVVSQDPGATGHPGGARVARSLPGVGAGPGRRRSAAAGRRTSEFFVIGGESVYRRRAAVADRIYLTRVHGAGGGGPGHARRLAGRLRAGRPGRRGRRAEPAAVLLPRLPAGGAVSLYCFENVRTAEQRAEMAPARRRGDLPVLPGGPGQPCRGSGSCCPPGTGRVTPNEFPYPGTSLHLLLVPHQHAGDLLDLS